MKTGHRSVTDENEQTLDQDIEKYTRKLELERKRRMNLIALCKETQKDLGQIKTQVAKKRRESQESTARVLSAKEKTAAARAEICHKKTNEKIGEVNELKMKIDVLRKERTQFLHIFQEMETEMDETEERSKAASEAAGKARQAYQKEQHDIAGHLSRHRQDSSGFMDTLKGMNAHIDSLPISSKSRVQPPPRNQLGIDTASILKSRLQKLIMNNKEKVRIIDIYQRNMTVIDQSFNSIKEATGLTDIDEIQTTFIKSEEQNCGLLTYLDIINQEIDFLHDQNCELEKRCLQQESQNQERLRVLQGTPDEEKRRRRISNIIEKKNQTVDQLKNLLKSLSSVFQQVFMRFSSSIVERDRAKQFRYKSGVVLNESNFQQHLAQFENYFDKVLQFRAKQNKVSLFIADGMTLKEKDGRDKMNQTQPFGQAAGQTEAEAFLTINRLKEQAAQLLDKGIGQGRKKKA